MKNHLQTTNYKLPTNSGFTLVEILVVFTIVALLTGIGFASLVTYSRIQQIEQLSSNIKLLMVEAKFNSLSAVNSVIDESGVKIDCGNDKLIGYSVLIPSSTSVELKMICSIGSAKPIRLINLPNGITFVSANPATNCTNIQFETLPTIVTGGNCSLKISWFGQYKMITIDMVGNVSIN